MKNRGIIARLPEGVKDVIAKVSPVMLLRQDVKREIEGLTSSGLAKDEAGKRKNAIAHMDAAKIRVIPKDILLKLSSDMLSAINAFVSADQLKGGIASILTDTRMEASRLSVIGKNFPHESGKGITKFIGIVFHDDGAGTLAFDEKRFFKFSVDVLEAVKNFQADDLLRWSDILISPKFNTKGKKLTPQDIEFIQILPKIPFNVQTTLLDGIDFITLDLIQLLIKNPPYARNMRVLLVDMKVKADRLPTGKLLNQILSLDLPTLQDLPKDFIESRNTDEGRLWAIVQLIKRNRFVYMALKGSLHRDTMRADRIEALADLKKEMLPDAKDYSILANAKITTEEIQAVVRYLTVAQFEAMGGWQTLMNEEFSVRDIEEISRIKKIAKIERIAKEGFKGLHSGVLAFVRRNARSVGGARAVERKEEARLAELEKKRLIIADVTKKNNKGLARISNDGKTVTFVNNSGNTLGLGKSALVFELGTHINPDEIENGEECRLEVKGGAISKVMRKDQKGETQIFPKKP